jgi:hypothetical protein
MDCYKFAVVSCFIFDELIYLPLEKRNIYETNNITINVSVYIALQKS